MIGAAEAIIFLFLPALCVSVSHWFLFPFFVFSKASEILLLQIKLILQHVCVRECAHTHTHTQTHTHKEVDTAFWLGCPQGSSSGSPISVGCVCV